MKQYSIKSSKFPGSIEVVYVDGVLSKLDFSGTDSNPYQREVFKERIPTSEEILPTFISDNKLVCVETAFEVSFEMFWKEYPYKRNRLSAKDVFDKMKHADQVLAWDSAKEYAKYCTRNKWYNAKIADSWLKKREFENNWKTL